jgi:DNA-binding transcriptional LysR family regulator
LILRISTMSAANAPSKSSPGLPIDRDAIVAMVAAGLGVTVVPRPRQPLISAYAVRELRLGRNAPTRRIALVCRGVDRDDRRTAAVRTALSEAFAWTGD